MTTKVIFRKFNDGEIIALFPTLIGTNDPYTCSSYMHTGQHGSATPDIVSVTSLATPDEYAGLLSELISIGYDDLIIRKKFFYADSLKRKEALLVISS